MRTGRLTDQQRRVMMLVAQGKTNEEIAEVLGLGRRTIDTHVRNSTQALGVHNRTAAVVLALHYGEIDLDEVARAILPGD